MKWTQNSQLQRKYIKKKSSFSENIKMGESELAPSR